MTEDRDDILRDIRRWVKIIGIQEAKNIMDDALSAEDSEEEEQLRLVYHLTDGEHSTRDIYDYADFGRNKIIDLQKSWAKMGLLEKEHSRAPYEHVISLEEAGVEVPEVPKPEEEPEEPKESTESEEDGSEEELVEEPELTDYE
ncbi:MULTISPECIES: hypothetical protein [unclassified Haloferax]|uniref:hypothetical protein n=1 Tax=unclassified Haloferax TaxID=2625095 RepID=UPI0012670611|nr:MULTISPECIES: hypothetical protein [unclassified Haloferax]